MATLYKPLKSSLFKTRSFYFTQLNHTDDNGNDLSSGACGTTYFVPNWFGECTVKHVYKDQTYNSIYYEKAPLIYLENKHGWVLKCVHSELKDVKVKQGQKLKVGDPIAATGNTGFAKGCHVHLALKINGKWVRDLAQRIEEDKSLVEPKKLKAGQYMVKNGGWQWNVVEELVAEGIWKGPVTQKLCEDFYKLNNPTPHNGYKAGDIVTVKKPAKPTAGVTVSPVATKSVEVPRLDTVAMPEVQADNPIYQPLSETAKTYPFVSESELERYEIKQRYASYPAEEKEELLIDAILDNRMITRQNQEKMRNAEQIAQEKANTKNPIKQWGNTVDQLFTSKTLRSLFKYDILYLIGVYASVALTYIPAIELWLATNGAAPDVVRFTTGIAGALAVVVKLLADRYDTNKDGKIDSNDRVSGITS